MARTAKDITDAELAVMNLLWKRGDTTAIDLVSSLYPNGDRSSYVVLQGLLKSLERKGFVKRNRKCLPHRIEPKIDRDVLIGRSLQAIADKLCGGSVDPLLQQLVHATLTTSQLDSICGLIKVPM